MSKVQAQQPSDARKALAVNLVSADDFGVIAVDHKPMVSSRYVANVFKKRHDHVLEAIRSCGCSNEFALPNFRETYYKDSQGKKQPEILMTRDGFTFIVMGFKGKKAAMFKEAYINRFNEMETFIKNRLLARLEYPELTDSIKQAHDPAKFYHYSNESDMINRIVLGVTAKQFRLANGLPKDASIRDYLTVQQVEAIQKLQKLDSVLVVAMPDFQQRKESLTNYYERMFRKELVGCQQSNASLQAK